MHSDLHNEKELLKLLAQQDSEYAFTIIFDHYRPRVFGTAMKLLKDAAMAEEIVQDIFLKLWIKRHDMESIQHLGSFIMTMTKNLVFDRFRKKMNEAAYLEKLNSAALVIDDTDHRVRASLSNKILQQAIEQLPLRQRQVYEMVRIQGLSMDDISQKLSISKSTAKGHLTAALQAIRHHLNAHTDVFTGMMVLPVLIQIFHSSR